MHDNKVTCKTCDNHLEEDNALFDEQKEIFFCDEGCFEDWADSHFEVIIEQYKQLHVYTE